MLTVYKASAGSGKTYRLTYEYIKMLLGYKTDDGSYRLRTQGKEHHRAILAITFTNKATDEMKQRIVKELANLAEIDLPEFHDKEDGKYKFSPYIKELTTELSCSQEELKVQALKAIKELLFDYTFFNISTIDSFFQNVLRTFAREADLTGDYEVKMDHKEAVSSSLAQTLNDLSYEFSSKNRDKNKEWLKQYMKEQFELGLTFDIYNHNSSTFTNIAKYLSDICDDTFKKNYEAIYKYLSDPNNLFDFQKDLKKHIESLFTDINKAAADLLATELGEIKFPTFVSNNMANAIEKHKNLKATDKLGDLGKAIPDGLESLDKRYLKKYLYIAEKYPDFDSKYSNTLKLILNNRDRIEFYRAIISQLTNLGLLASVIDGIDKYRKENNLILISDTDDILKKIIADEEVPFIYERMGMILRHYLIDEFQDTSHAQWDNLKPLVKTSQSENHDNLIIGDEKQSIYRFRGSDPELLGEQVQTDKAFAKDLKIKGLEISENTNWRSSIEVIQFNNTLFTALVANDIKKIKERYGNVAQQIPDKHSDFHGYVKVLSFKDNLNVDIRKTLAMQLTGEEIDRQLGAGYKQSDIAILVSTNDEGRDIINYLLTKHHFDNAPNGKINISSAESLHISKSSAVRIIISILRQLDKPSIPTSDKAKKLQEIDNLIKNYEENLKKGDTPSNALLQASLYPTQMDNSLTDAIAKMECATLTAIVDLIIDQYLTDEIRKNENIFLTAFQDEVVDYCSTTNGDLHAFLKWWDKFGYRVGVTMPEDFDAVKVMTIHKSKGLEFKCVHIPFATWKLNNDDLIWYNTHKEFEHLEHRPPFIPLKGTSAFKPKCIPLSEQYQKACEAAYLDNLNKTYVAFTRAVNEMFIISGNNSQLGKHINEAFGSAHSDAVKKYAEELEYKGSTPIFAPLNGYSDGCFGEYKYILTTLGEPTTAEKEETDKDKKTEAKSDKDEENKNIPYALSNDNAYYVVHKEKVGKLSKVDDIDDIYDKRQRGIIMHNILAHVYTVDDLPKAVRLQAYRSLIPDEEVPKIEAELRQQISREDTRHWFEDAIRIVNERTIALTDGTRLRCDRIVWTADGHIDIIDYKTGNPSAEQIEDYHEQVARYAKHLAENGYTNLRGYLWFIDSGEIIEVPLN